MGHGHELRAHGIKAHEIKAGLFYEQGRRTEKNPFHLEKKNNFDKNILGSNQKKPLPNQIEISY